MADQVKQLAFKEFTRTELENGTAANVLTTDASTHYVIKSIEATQGSNSDAVVATATLGLTAGLATGQFTSIGTCAKANRVGLVGSAIMDASSTLSIRPTAKTITFTDETIYQGAESAANSRKYAKAIFPSVNGNADTALNSETINDKTSVTYSGGSYNSMQNYPAGNHIISHTNANGVELRILFGNGSGSGCYFEVWNADGTYYGYYYDSHDRPLFDGSRYIFWVHCDGASTTRVKWYDLDESTTNLAAANTLGGSSGNNFCHGQTAVWNDSPAINARQTYDNHLNCFFQNRHTDNRRYLAGWSDGNQKMWMCELPTTLTNDASTTPTVKWLYLSGNSQNTGGTDPFGSNVNSTWNMTSLFVSQYTRSNTTQLQLTFDPDKSRFYMWYTPANHYWFLFTFTQSEWDNRPSGNMLDNPQGDSYGLRLVSNNSANEVNLSTNAFQNYSSNNGYIPIRSSTPYSYYGNVYPASYGPAYIDGTNWYFKDDNSGNSASYRKCVKVNMKNADSHTVLFPTTSIASSYTPDLLVTFGSPNSHLISNRNYTVAPGLKVRVTGILSDQ